MKKRITAFLTMAVLVCTLLAGCGSSAQSAASGSAAPAEPHANEITVGLAQDLDDSLDPHAAGTSAGTREVMFNVFEGLMKPSTDGNVVPALAEKVDVSEDGMTYTFTLREGVQYHNGHILNTDDVLYSFERCAHPTDPELQAIPALEVVEKAEATDDRTVVFTLAKPDAEFLSNMTLAIIPADYTEQAASPVGSGPFKFVSRAAQDSVVLEKFNEYWGEPASLDKVTLKIVENADSMVLSLQSGAIDLCNHLPTAQAVQLADEFDIVEGSMSLVQALYLNNGVEPFNNELVRQAMCYATDRQQILDVAFDGYGSLIGSSMYPALGKYFDESLTDTYTYDPEKAKALLAEAGYPDGFAMTITAPSNYPQHVDTAMVLAEQYKAIGLDVTIENVEWNTWLDKVYKNRDFQTTVVGLDASTLTARAMLARFHSESPKNFVNYSDPEYDELFDAALAATTDAEQTELYRAAEANLAEHAANVYIQAPADLVAVRKGLTGVRFYPIYVLDLAGLSWE